jgi:hypothetical protein
MWRAGGGLEAAVVAAVDPAEAPEVLLKMGLPAFGMRWRPALRRQPWHLVSPVFAGRESGLRLTL